MPSSISTVNFHIIRIWSVHENFFTWKTRSDTKISEILQNFEFESRKYPQLPVRIHKTIMYSVLWCFHHFQASAGRPRMSLFPSMSSFSSYFPWWDTGHIQGLGGQRGLSGTRTARTFCEGLLFENVENNFGRSRSISQTLGQQFSKIIGRKKFIGNIHFTV